MSSPKEQIAKIDDRLEQLPKGTLTYKNINGKKQPYIQKTVNGKSVSYYVKLSEREYILEAFDERKKLLEQKQRLMAYLDEVKDILMWNPYLDEKVGCGSQSFREFACGKQFYVDKTQFISEWMFSEAKVTLITRPRRFGKTTMISTVEYFLDPRLSGHPEYFEKLNVWRTSRVREWYGKIPTVSVSFGSCKGANYNQAMKGISNSFFMMYDAHSELLKSSRLSEDDREEYRSLREMFRKGEVDQAEVAIPRLCRLLSIHYGTLPVILLDEYDTPLLEAYTDGYWNEMIGTCRQLFHCAFKENPYYDRAIITGITRVTKNSLFSDMNNIEVDTVTCKAYSDSFGFTEKEVSDALKCQNLTSMSKIKSMYNGFIIGGRKDIYNPWSICNYLRNDELLSYWTNTSSNELIRDVIRKHPVRSKYEIERLMSGEVIHKEINENITFQYLDGDENSLWSLLLAVGYIKADNVKKRGELTECDVSVTNQEVMDMFRYEILEMFKNGNAIYNEFVTALLDHQVEKMSDILTEIAYSSMSYFDTGKQPSDRVPENFYHGLVLGLIVSLRDRYHIRSNRESGRGRYDIAMYPINKDEDAFIMEFKIHDSKNEQSLADTAENALQQIKEKAYETDLLAAGISEAKIYKIGFAFSGKDILVIERK